MVIGVSSICKGPEAEDLVKVDWIFISDGKW